MVLSFFVCTAALMMQPVRCATICKFWNLETVSHILRQLPPQFLCRVHKKNGYLHIPCTIHVEFKYHMMCHTSIVLAPWQVNVLIYAQQCCQMCANCYLPTFRSSYYKNFLTHNVINIKSRQNDPYFDL